VVGSFSLSSEEERMLSIIDNSGIDVILKISEVGGDFCIGVCKPPTFARFVKAPHIVVRLSHWGAVIWALGFCM
jgi:hypothetical protein